MVDQPTRIEQAAVRNAYRSVVSEIPRLALGGIVILGVLGALYATGTIPFSEASPYFIIADVSVLVFGVGVLVLSAVALYVGRAMMVEARRQNRISSSTH